MKNLFKTVALALVGGSLLFSACNKSSDGEDPMEFYRKQDLYVDSILNGQKTAIEAYVNANFTNGKQDTLNFQFAVIEKKTKRGIWYEILSEPTDNTYEYKVNNSGSGYVFPKVKVKYTAKLLNGTVVQKDETGTDYSLATGSNPEIINALWQFSFFPYSIKFTGKDYYPGGLTKNGLKKGSKIRVVGPSIWGFGSRVNKEIPANSPLVYEFEVLGIE